MRLRRVEIVPGPELYLSVVATTLAVASFGASTWRLWRDRPRLQFYLSPITFTNVPHFGDMNMIQIMICNIGYRPVILTRFMAFGETSSFSMGIDDEPAAAIGRQDQRFPTLLEPGQTLKIHPIGLEALRRNLGPRESPRHHHDPFRFFVISDSFDNLFPIKVSEAAWHLSLVDKFSPDRGLKRLRQRFADWKFLRSARKRLKRDRLG